MGRQIVAQGGDARDATVTGAQFVASGGRTYGTVISAGGIEIVSSGGSAASTIVEAGGMLVNAGGFITGAHFAFGAISGVQGAVASKSVVSNGLTLEALAGGKLVDTLVTQGGREIVLGGGSATGTVLSGGSAFVSAGGTFNGGKVLNGAALFDSGIITSGLVMSGARVTLAPGAQVGGGQRLEMDGANRLDVLPNVQVGALVAGFGLGDVIDLWGPGFVGGLFGSTLSYTQFNQQGTSFGQLQVHGGLFGAGTSQSLLFAGDYSAQNFAMGPDGHGGTQLTYRV
jgi:autotransporter passenger strand-loop-strand repeat protein